MVQMTASQRERMHNWVTIPLVFGLIIPAIIVVAGILWYEPHPIAHFQRTAWPTEVHAGEVINIRADVLRSKSGCASIVTRTWHDEIGQIVGEPYIFENPGIDAGSELYASTATVPLEALPGKIVMRTSVNFRCNFVQEIAGGTVLPLHDIVFTVLP